MRIVHIAAEFAPLAKAGGLGEVVLGLCRELSRSHEHEVDIIIPKYDLIDMQKIRDVRMEVPDFRCFEKGNLHANAMWSGRYEECRLHLLEARHPAGYFHRKTIYGAEDDIARFLYFSRAALEYLKLQNKPIDILHLHDWHVSLCAPMVKDFFAKELKVGAIVLNIHNSEYQGKCAIQDLDAIGLKGADYLTKNKLQDDDPAHPNTINLLKGGIVYSDAIVPVSPSYAKEILTPQMGFHLEKTLQQHKEKITGILNGIDTKIWDPSSDPDLAQHFNAENAYTAIQKAKEANKAALARKFHLPIEKKPWIGSITRLVPQKGPELIEETIKKTSELGGCFLLLGSSPDAKIQAHFNQLKKHYAGHPQIFLQFSYDDQLAHLIYAALDFVLVPSHFEPCGLTQLISMRYGTVPIVRSTGGLKDTVFDCENPKVPIQQRNGFTFPKATRDSLLPALERAIHLYRTDATAFQSLVRRCIQTDSSWKKPSQEYLRLYTNKLKN